MPSPASTVNRGAWEALWQMLLDRAAARLAAGSNDPQIGLTERAHPIKQNTDNNESARA